MMGIRRALESRRQRHADLLLAILAAKPSGRFGYEMWKLSGIRSAPMYAALDRLEREGLVESGWAEWTDPQRRLYRITRRAFAAAGKDER